MRLFGRQTQIATPAYCKGPCTCGQNCHDDPELHQQMTGALTSDQYYSGEIIALPEDFDEDLFESAMQTLGAR